MLNNLYNNTPVWQNISKGIWNDLVNNSSFATFNKNETIIKCEQVSNGVYIIRKGILKITFLDYKGEEQIVQILGKNAIFGYEEVITNHRFYNTIIAVTRCEIEIINKGNFLSTINNSIDLMSAFIAYSAANNYVLINKLIYFERKPLIQRLALTLLLLNFSLGLNEEIDFQRKDISNYLGTSPEAHSRQLRILKSNNIIRTAGKKISIIDIKKLYELISQ